MTDEETVDIFPLQNEDERRAAAYAVYRERQAREGDELVESLSLRERYLIEAAWDTGAAAVQARFIKALDNPLATTLDAAAVRSELRKSTLLLDAIRPRWKRQFEPHFAPEVVGVVRHALRRLEHEGEQS